VLAPSGKTGSAVWDGTAVSVTADDVTEFKAWAPGIASFASGPFTHLAVLEGSQLHWRGSRRLLDVQPEGTPAFQDDFSSTVAAHWASYPLWSRFSRVIGGEYCDQGRNGQGTSFVSHTNRSFDPYRADTLQSPRAIYGDATWKGTFTVQASPAPPGAAKVVLLARVADRSLSIVDQDSVRLEMDVATGSAVLTGRVAGAVTTLWSGSVGTVGTGIEHAYAWTLDGNSLSFKLDGVQRFSVTASPGRSPPRGTWSGRSSPVSTCTSTTWSSISRGAPWTPAPRTPSAPTGSTARSTSAIPPPTPAAIRSVRARPPSRIARWGSATRANDQCVEQSIQPPPPPWRCGSHWCICAELLE
jgi:hypothetical protein